jgi:hypothetical protein
MQDRWGQWKYSTFYKNESLLSNDTFAIDCRMEIFEHMSTLTLDIQNHNLKSVSTSFANVRRGKIFTNYSYRSVIERGYGDFTPFLTKEYTLAEIPHPIVPIDYQRELESIRKNLHFVERMTARTNEQRQKEHR